MREDLRKRLRELGVVRGVRQLGAPAVGTGQAVEDLVPGRFHTTSRGQCYVVEEQYSLEHLHGHLALSSFLEIGEEGIAAAAQTQELAGVDPERYCFLDTETTGLSGGTGTMAFVVGLGCFHGQSFLLRQYFLRDPGDEPAMIEALADELSQFAVFVSFNGRAFDVPILDTRFVLDRRPPVSEYFQQLDLLHLARRLWRYRLDSCALGVLEREVLGVEREQADVPSGMIPLLYRDYLRTGDAREMRRVIYHNAVDILSLVTLAALLGRILSDPWAVPALSGSELYALARWYKRLGQHDDAERAYRSALEARPEENGRRQARLAGGLAPEDVRAGALRGLAYLLKRSDRRAEAYGYWQQLALEAGAAIDDPALAARWTQAAIELLDGQGLAERRAETLTRLRHRLERLERKLDTLAGAGPAGPGAASEPEEEGGDAGAT
jgi:uncharacterized protein YprB with RNaseH-like and TPR domain